MQINLKTSIEIGLAYFGAFVWAIWIPDLFPLWAIFIPLFVAAIRRISSQSFLGVCEPQSILPAIGWIVVILILPATLLSWIRWNWQWPQMISSEVFLNVTFLACVEEFFFRGYMHSRLRFRTQDAWRIAGAQFGWEVPLTAFLFALIHLADGSLHSIPVLFPAGLALGWCRARSKGIYACCIVHILLNVWLFGFENS